MKYAIDRYSMGTEKEVNADDFDEQYYIPSRRNRFYCPECDEIVYFRSKGGNNPNHFYHQEKTDRTPECDRRVDGRSGLSLNERVGLPIYMTTLFPGKYRINIGFPAIGAEILYKAALANYKVEISFGNQCRMVKVDSTNFFEEKVSLIPVNFIPTNSRNYTITISGDRNIFGLQRKWSNYADGFDPGGAIFSYEDFGGKKVRRGDSISTNKSYYAVMKNALPRSLNVQQTLAGTLDIDQATYSVYKIDINVSLEDKGSFSDVRSYFKRYFGVWLLEYSPELIPIWPPVIQQECLTPVSDSSDVVCAISSGNTLPNVYVYSEYGFSEKTISHEYAGIKTVEITVGKRPVTLSVDRKYVGREISFLSKPIPESNYRYEVDIGKSSDTTILWKDLNRKLLSSGFVVISNSKMELYSGSKGKSFQRIPIREQYTIVPAMENTDELYFVVESVIIKQLQYIERKKQFKVDEELAQQISKAQRGQMVQIPRWADHYIRSLKNHHDDVLFSSIMSKVVNGQIHTEVLRLLRAYDVGRHNS